VIALDAKTGQLLWDVQGAEPTRHEGFNSAPIAWQRKVFIGIAVSEEGIAGRLMAFDARTGQELWRFNTTLGAEAGGAFWTTYSLDPKTGEVFGGSPTLTPISTGTLRRTTTFIPFIPIPSSRSTP
jgi:outer membrane protein assembly factor BamB